MWAKRQKKAATKTSLLCRIMPHARHSELFITFRLSITLLQNSAAVYVVHPPRLQELIVMSLGQAIAFQQKYEMYIQGGLLWSVIFESTNWISDSLQRHLWSFYSKKLQLKESFLSSKVTFNNDLPCKIFDRLLETNNWTGVIQSLQMKSMHHRHDKYTTHLCCIKSELRSLVKNQSEFMHLWPWKEASSRACCILLIHIMHIKECTSLRLIEANLFYFSFTSWEAI